MRILSFVPMCLLLSSSSACGSAESGPRSDAAADASADGPTACPDAADDAPTTGFDAAADAPAGPDAGSDTIGTCDRLCATEEDACETEQGRCLDYCRARLGDLGSTCRSCLASGASNVECMSGGIRPGQHDASSPDAGPCCPLVPSFPNEVVECEEACGDERGIAARSEDDPRCLYLCGLPEAEGSCPHEDIESCLAQCHELIGGRDGTCASCLAERSTAVVCPASDGGTASAPCCPQDLETANAEACDAFCR